MLFICKSDQDQLLFIYIWILNLYKIDTMNWNEISIAEYIPVHIKITFRFHELHCLCLTGLSHIVGSKPMWHDSTRHEEPDDFLVRKQKLEKEGVYETE